MVLGNLAVKRILRGILLSDFVKRMEHSDKNPLEWTKTIFKFRCPSVPVVPDSCSVFRNRFLMHVKQVPVVNEFPEQNRENSYDLSEPCDWTAFRFPFVSFN